LAKGGSGDVLSGICAGLMARGLSPLQAAICGNYLHGLAADNMAEQLGAISALPSDLFKFLPNAIKSLAAKGRV
jgi:NAD(P)H-hydrate epimerase